jgi:uncharacterized protein YjlB
MLLEDIKAMGEKLTGYRRPGKVSPRPRKAHLFRFADDGQTPNNPHFPLTLYRSPVRLDPDYDPATLFETLFAAHGWHDSWRDGIYDFLHFHTHSHEVLGIARGQAPVRFGGGQGRVIEVRAGDVIILPAGTGHQRLSKSKDLLVVGARPRGGKYDEPRPDEVDHAEAVRSIARVHVPAHHPVYGGPMKNLWSS